ncbi:MAG TPA: hypothetical protein VIB02_07820 [Candidatus Limnocylindrales bacterium]
MTAQSIVCRSCAADVPGGRLSCPSCGELLASVAGSRRSEARAGGRRVVPDVLYDVPAGPADPIVEGQLALDGAAVDAGPARRDPAAELPWATAMLEDADDDTDDGLDDARDERNGSTGPHVDHRDAAPGSTPADTAEPTTQGWQVGAASLQGGPTPAYMPRPDRRPPAASTAPAGAPVVAHGSVAPGAYVPPLPVLPSAPAGAVAPARAWAGHAASTPGDAPDAPSGRSSSAELDDRARMLEFVRWLTVAGSAFAAMGFLLPWGLVVIGSADTTYFGRWGLAGPWHAVVALGLLAVLALGLVQNGIPAWLRSGLPGLGLGALLLGLVWPYLALPTLGTGPGAIMAAVGALALAVSGVLAIVADRHAEPGASV